MDGSRAHSPRTRSGLLRTRYSCPREYGRTDNEDRGSPLNRSSRNVVKSDRGTPDRYAGKSKEIVEQPLPRIKYLAVPRGPRFFDQSKGLATDD